MKSKIKSICWSLAKNSQNENILCANDSIIAIFIDNQSKDLFIEQFKNKLDTF